ncbi:MAG: hypothetical protein AAGJ18_17105, partial [Bacteroidota bacterium]
MRLFPHTTLGYWPLAITFPLLALCSILTAQIDTKSFYSPDSIVTQVTTNYEGGKLKRLAYGNRYRKSWETKVKVPIYDMGTTFKHLKPVKKGGGMSTKSLRLEDGTGREYVLRSVYKNGRAGVQDRFRGTIYEDILQDLRVGAHPFAAQLVPPLADAVGVYHTNPKVYYLPKQPELGEYEADFGGELYLFEERPNEGWEHLESFGLTQKIIGFDRLIEKTQRSAKHRVDEKWVLKSRLFDLFIGDYDRHDDQWRWAVFPDEENDQLIYRPIPRDRDLAFYDINGVLPWILSRDFIHIQQKPFAKRIQDIKAFGANAKHFDRAWLTRLEQKDWIEVAKKFRDNLSDTTIEQAVALWPPKIYELNGPYLIKALKGRRDNSVKHAVRLYKLLAKYVDVVGTEKDNHFVVEKVASNQLLVKVFQMGDEGKVTPFYERTFRANETKEIRLYGLAGNNTYEFKETTKSPILVRIIGGTEQDQLINPPTKSASKKVVVYDRPDGIKLPDAKTIKRRLSKDSTVNNYNRKEFQYNEYLPTIFIGNTQDDGFLFGGGATFTRYGFRKRPFSARHQFSFRFSTQTDALHLSYQSDFTEAIGPFNFNPTISFDRPIIFNYYGLGNNSAIRQDDQSYHWVRLKRFRIAPLLKKLGTNPNEEIRFGPFYQNVIAVQTPGRIAADAPSLFRPNDFGNKSFLGFLVERRSQHLDDLVLPTKGWRYNAGLTYFRNLNEEVGYANVEGTISGFTSFRLPFQVTLGGRVGFAHLSDDNYYFFHNNNLGGNNFLRGFRNNRFAGTTSLFYNLDLRVPLFYFKNRIAPGQVGLFVGYDSGRVWYPNANEDGWKTSISP